MSDFIEPKIPKYFQFPLFLLRDLMVDKEKTLNNIIHYGLYSFAMKLKVDLNSVIRQLMYSYYRDRDVLPCDLLRSIEKYIDSGKIDLDDDYNGFNGKVFNPENETEQILQIFQTDKDFQLNAEEFYKMRQTYKVFKVNGSFDSCIVIGKEIQKSIPPGEPMPMISIEKVFEFRNKDKTEFELMKFAVNIGIRSILGQKSYCKTNKEMILCRAFGYTSNKYLPETLPELFTKYSNRYHFDKIKDELETENWNLHFYSNYMRGFYVGLRSQISLKQLIEIAEMKKKKKKIEHKRKEKQLLKKKVLLEIEQQIHQQNYCKSTTP